MQKSDAEIDRYRGNAEQTRQEMVNLEISLRREAEQGMSQVKAQVKDKYKQRIVQIEACNQENIQIRLHEAERNIRELHKKDIEVQAEKFELRLKSGYLKISEHEVIVRQLQAKEREAQSSALVEAQVTKEAQLAQLSDGLRD